MKKILIISGLLTCFLHSESALSQAFVPACTTNSPNSSCWSCWLPDGNSQCNGCNGTQGTIIKLTCHCNGSDDDCFGGTGGPCKYTDYQYNTNPCSTSKTRNSNPRPHPPHS